ncbi:unnamed protein product, partial [Ixodes hexagonus]
SETEQPSLLLNTLTNFLICGWPLADTEKASNWKSIYRKIRVGADLGIIFTLDVDTYLSNTTIRAISMDFPKFVPSLQQIGKADENDNATMAYKTFIQETVRLFSNNTDNTTLKKIADEIFYFEVNLTKVSVNYDYSLGNCSCPNNGTDYEAAESSSENCSSSTASAPVWRAQVRHLPSMPQSTKLRDIDTRLGSEGWLQLIKDIFGDISVNLTGEEEVNIWDESFLKNAMNLIKKTSPATVSNYFGWKLLYKLGPIASDEMRKLNLEFNQVWRGLKGEEPHWRQCVNAINDPYDPIISYGLGDLYVKKYFNSSEKTDVENLALQIKNISGTIINSTIWMNETTKEKAQLKLNNMVFKMGYPSDMTNETLLESMYQPVGNITRNDTFIDIYLKFRKSNAIYKLQKIHSAYDRTEEWPLEPMKVNGYHNLRDNSNVLPVALLQYPFYSLGVPSSVKMGTLGFILGHEVTHAFVGPGNLQRRHYYLDGNYTTWWSEQGNTNFSTAEQCVRDLYNRTEEKTGLKVSPLRTFSENFADIKGLETAFLAHKKFIEEQKGEPQRLPCLDQVDPDQLFFISLAYSFCQNDQRAELIDIIERDPHSPSKIRVNVLLGNSKSFLTTFRCNNTDPMHLNSTCDV